MRSFFQLEEVLNKHRAMVQTPLERLAAPQARELPELRDAVQAVLNDHFSKRMFKGLLEEVEQVDHVKIPGPDSVLLARVYRPHDGEDLPVVLFFHGGGFVLGNLNSSDSVCRALCNAAQCLVVSLAYRLAPEHSCPAAHEDAFAAFQWLLANAHYLGGDHRKIAVVGECAGGSLATSICLRARHERLPQPTHQVLIYPLLDHRRQGLSHFEHIDAWPLSANRLQWYLQQYFDANVPGLDSSEVVCPFAAANYLGMAPATIILAEKDPLTSDGLRYADRLAQFGVNVSVKTFEGMTHDFVGAVAVVDAAREAIQLIADRLKQQWTDSPWIELRPSWALSLTPALKVAPL